MTMQSIGVAGLSKSYRTAEGEDLPVLDEVSLSVPAASFFSLLGPSTSAPFWPSIGLLFAPPRQHDPKSRHGSTSRVFLRVDTGKMINVSNGHLEIASI